ncbi:MAG: RecX family transcriptional regulator [Sedimentibacter sp.]|uniref:regulatory protein RecX n=1 Tax=Sedimentibacter sp. TaxID=1960295 RepID=UPI003158AEC5
MKKITKIEYQKNNKDRLNVYLDDSYAFSVDMDVMIKYSLAKNKVLEDDFISQVLKAEEEVKAYSYAVGLLSRFPKSEKQLRDKMTEKGYDDDFIDSAISRLKEHRYLDDERYTDMVINSRLNTSKEGKLKIRESLYSKGIDREIINEKLGNISAEDELERACALGGKKLSSINEDDTRKKMVKLSNYLVNKGFEYGTVRKAVSRLMEKGLDELGEFDD